MASHNEMGKEAEQMAVDYLVGCGFEILHCNWRFAWYEIDIVARKNGMLRIVEVKALKTAEIHYPEEAVTRKKFRRIQKAADEYLYLHQEYRHIQFDILAITIPPGHPPEFFLIEDVFL